MLIEQIVEQIVEQIIELVIFMVTTGYFHDKTKISKENLRVGFHLLLKWCTVTRQCTLFPPT